MVNNHYRWDFIGLSTDDKPTSETSEKVVNGSTFYCSDTSKLYVYCDGTWYERKALGGGGGGGTSDFDELDNRPKYNGTTMTGETNIPEVPTVNDATLTITQNGSTAGTFTANDADDTTIALTDTTYSNFTGTDGTSAGTAGLVPAPATTDADKFLKSDGTWDTAGGGSVTPVQTPGDSTTDVMSQNATTSMVFGDPTTRYNVRIGTTIQAGDSAVAIGRVANGSYPNTVAIGYGSASAGNDAISVGHSAGANSTSAICIGNNSSAGNRAIAIGGSTSASGKGAIALGYGALAQTAGQISVGTSNPQYGYNNSAYRLISGVHDGQTDHDAVTVGQVNAVIDAINTALSTNIPHIGA